MGEAVNPGLVMISSQLLGSHGVWADWIGYGPSTQPFGGLVHLWNYDDQEDPAGSGAIFPDHLAGRISALAAAAFDLDGSRHIDFPDFLEFADAFGQTTTASSVPEPIGLPSLAFALCLLAASTSRSRRLQ